MSGKLDSLPQCSPPDRRSWRRWLERHHSTSPGVWMVFHKKASGVRRVSYNDAVEEALCFGWVDSLARKLDDERYLQLFTPRKAKSSWAKSNKERIERLIAAGLMTDAGLRKIEAAKRDGSWDAYDAVDALELPPDLSRALGRNAAAARHFDAFSRSVKKAILAWVLNARRPETREARIEKTVRMAARGLRAQIDKE